MSVEDKAEFVEEFSELGRFLREPLKTYSSGMRARLAFALSMAIEFDCFLIDEVITVGDARFHEKCQRRAVRKERGPGNDHGLPRTTHHQEPLQPGLGARGREPAALRGRRWGISALLPSLNSIRPSPVFLTEKTDGARRVSVLLELRPAMDGFAGIPQETRLLFRGLRLLDEVRLEGLIQHSVRRLARGTRPKGKPGFFPLSPGRKLNRYSRVIVSLGERPFKTLFDKIVDSAQKGIANVELSLTTLLQDSYSPPERL